MTPTDHSVTIVEVSPRDGLQNESQLVPAATKSELIRRLQHCGLREIEATSFVNPKAVPQMADAAEVMRNIIDSRWPTDNFPVLVPNMRGYENARAAGATSIAIFTAATDGFCQANIGMSVAESLANYHPLVEKARGDGVSVRGYISTAFGCPFDGEVAPSQVHTVADKLLQMGVCDISVGDTIGVAVPVDIAPVILPLIERSEIARLALHLHDTRGTAIANAVEGLRLGIRTFDASVGGLGGCPFAPGASGNIATEDLVWMLHQSGYSTGIDLAELVATAKWITGELGATPASHVATARLWPSGG